LVLPNALVRIEEVEMPHYTGDSKPIVFYCTHTLFTLAKGAFFSYKFANGTTRKIRYSVYGEIAVHFIAI